ncbi:MAG: hypothetical protein AABY22_08675 [Nanoarchaeota archaeon]
MFSKSVEVKQLENTNKGLKEENRILIKSLGDKITAHERSIAFQEKFHQLRIEESLNTLRKEMQKSLVESDISRVKAEEESKGYKARLDDSMTRIRELVTQNSSLIACLTQIKSPVSTVSIVK